MYMRNRKIINMELKNQLTSLELSKQLKDLGVKQESIFGWEIYDSGAQLKYKKDDRYKDYTNYAAFTVAELGEMLPYEFVIANLSYRLGISKDMGWEVEYKEINGNETFGEYDDQLVNAMAGMLIYLLKGKLIEV